LFFCRGLIHQTHIIYNTKNNFLKGGLDKSSPYKLIKPLQVNQAPTN